MSYVSIEKHYFVLYDGIGALTLRVSKMTLNPFCNDTLHDLYGRILFGI